MGRQSTELEQDRGEPEENRQCKRRRQGEQELALEQLARCASARDAALQRKQQRLAAERSEAQLRTLRDSIAASEGTGILGLRRAMEAADC